MTTKRKPWVQPVSNTWWWQSGAYRFYILRECTAIPFLWFALELIAGLFALRSGQESWLHFIQFLQHPIIWLLNLVTLAAMLLHSKTWFELAPKASHLVLNGRKLPDSVIVRGLWTAWLLVSLILAAIMLWH